MRTFAKAFAAFAGTIATIAAAASPAVATKSTAKYTSLTVFGDSLVDAGNIFSETGQPFAKTGYFEGRYSNGYNYADDLSFALFGKPTLASDLGGTNFGKGGARTVSVGIKGRDLPNQLAAYDSYLSKGHSVDPNGLYILNFGANDLIGLASGSIGSYSSADAYIDAAVAQYASAVQSLNDLGARTIVIANAPSLGVITPYAANFNADLSAALSTLKLDASTTLDQFDYASTFASLAADPGAYGLGSLDYSSNCVAAKAQASGCAGYFSFDGTHPTAAVDFAIYQAMDRQFGLTVAAVPEPAAYALLMGSIGFVGGIMRRGRISVMPTLA